jgi:hypothetical protein
MSSINLTITGKQTVELFDEINCILDHKAPVMSVADTLSLKFSVGILQFDPVFLDKLRAIKKMVEGDVSADMQLDYQNLQSMRECLDLINSIVFCHKRNIQQSLMAKINEKKNNV